MNTKQQTPTLSPAFQTGVEQIDEQHRILIKMLADAQAYLENNHRPDRLAELVHDLMSYALYHFETEEVLMRDSRFDSGQQAAHIAEHRAFSAKIAEFRQALSRRQPVSGEALLRFLGEWLEDHMLNTDKRLGEFLTSGSHRSP